MIAPLQLLAAERGLRMSWLEVPEGVPPDAQAFAKLLEPGSTALVAVQAVNHETGTLLPVAEYAAACRAAGALCFVDATQALGKVPLDVASLGADLIALASHKIGGPAGAGALWVRRGVVLGSRQYGGGQERGRRAGTPDVLAQVGFAAACGLLAERLAAQPRIAQLRDQLQTALTAARAIVNAGAGPRVATACNMYFPGMRADTLSAALDLEGLAVSAGAACSSGKSEPSPVLLAMYAGEPARASASLRFSFGPQTTEIDVKYGLDSVLRVAARGLA